MKFDGSLCEFQPLPFRDDNDDHFFIKKAELESSATE